jgi:predicted metal-dependent HD superfamily phosphohydrolase
MDLGERWRHLWRRLGAISPPEPIWTSLAQAYTAPPRAYHTLEHIEDCLMQLDWAGHSAENEVEAALWFHDVIYDTRASDNEEQSAAWAESALRAGQVAQDVVARIGQLILATKHQAPPASLSAALVMDIDLSILGRDPAEFEHYEQAIRREYAWVPEAAFCAARAAILESFLRRAHVFETAVFRQRYEARARKNLASSIQRLRREC